MKATAIPEKKHAVRDAFQRARTWRSCVSRMPPMYANDARASGMTILGWMLQARTTSETEISADTVSPRGEVMSRGRPLVVPSGGSHPGEEKPHRNEGREPGDPHLADDPCRHGDGQPHTHPKDSRSDLSGRPTGASPHRPKGRRRRSSRQAERSLASRGGRSRRETGSASSNVLPEPGELLTRTVPPCASAMALTMARPRPTPPARRERPESARANRSKIRSALSGGIPEPESDTARRIVPFRRLAESSMRSPGLVCFTALSTRAS